MKNRMLAIFGGCLLALSAVGQEGGTTLQELRTKDDIRRTELFNFGWLFKAGDPAGAEHPAFDDSAWRQLDLPHDFQIEQPWDEQASRAHGFKTTGTAWYRKHFATDPAWAGKRIFLDFEGILTTGDVYLNGTLVGGTDYGYLGFETGIHAIVYGFFYRSRSGFSENAGEEESGPASYIFFRLHQAVIPDERSSALLSGVKRREKRGDTPGGLSAGRISVVFVKVDD